MSDPAGGGRGRGWPRRAGWAAVALGLGLLAAAGAGAQGARRDAGELGEKERALQQKQRQLREERAKVAEARKREAGLLAELEKMDRRLAAKRAQLAALDTRIRRAQAEVGNLQGEIRRLEAQRVVQQEALGRRLRALYKLEAQGGVLPALLSGEDPLGRAVRFRHLATLATVDARIIREYRGTTVALAERKGRVEARRAELGGLRAEAQEEQAALDAETAKRRVLLAKVRDERGYHERLVAELSEATRRLEAFIRELQSRQRRAVARAPTPDRPAPPVDPGAGLGALRGRLAWPVSGRVVGEFGPQVHPRFGTKTFRNGIDIEVAEGTTIQAPYPGHVVYSGWFRGYGNLVILDHGHEYYTLYGHVAELKVNEGDDVKQGQAIATVGDSGALGGPRLYFEVRHQGKPQDPVQWLRR